VIIGLSHVTFIVNDLERSAMFFSKVFGAKEIYSSGDKVYSLAKEKFFFIGGLWICAMEGTSTTERSYNHIAFQIQENEINDYMKRIIDIGAEVKPERPRVEGEGHSIYFYDFDNHLFELHTGTLNERLHYYNAIADKT